jgi:hypothetical protein
LVVVGATKKIKSISALSKHTFKSFASSGGISTTSTPSTMVPMWLNSVWHFQSEGKFSGRGKKRKKWRYLTIENHVRFKHCVDSDIKVRISKALSRIFLILPVILFAFNYLRNLAVSPRESFPICKKNGLKLSPIRYTI